MNHKDWLDNEYSEWIKALQKSTVHNFKEHPVVKRMLGVPDINVWAPHVVEIFNRYSDEVNKLIVTIENIGLQTKATELSKASLAAMFRYLYYADQILKRNPTSICEIGGGVGQFYAILRALGYKGEYFIIDLKEAMLFQDLYLQEVSKQTGLNLVNAVWGECDLIVSFYAFGEFDNDTKKEYSEFINSIPHGYIAWNPHSGASDDLSLFKHDIKVTPGIEPGIKIIEW